MQPEMYRPIGLCSLAAYVKQELPAVTVMVVDMACGEALPEADIYGWSCTSLDYDATVVLAKEVAKRRPDARQIIGGPHASVALPKDIDPVFSAVFQGEGEASLVRWMQADMTQWQRVWFPEQIKRIEDLPFPDRPWPEERAVIVASRGCPYHCAFCATQTVWKGFRTRNPYSVSEEMKQIAKKSGIKKFNLSDDTPSLFGIWGERLCIEIEGLGFDWRAQARVDLIETHMLTMLRSAGCTELCFGVESFDQRVLDALRKRTKVDQIADAIKATHNAGIRTRLYMMISTPGEKWDTAQINIDFLHELSEYIDVVNLQTFIPLPGTPVHKNPGLFGITINVDEVYNRYTQTPGGETPIWSPISIDGLPRAVQMANIRRMRTLVEGIK
jgi:radical SAM superfamily enzyme YgiQ (UPF0313 family)